MSDINEVRRKLARLVDEKEVSGLRVFVYRDDLRALLDDHARLKVKEDELASAVQGLLAAAPQQPVRVDRDEVLHVAQHIGAAADYIDKAYPDGDMLNRGPILRNMRRWHKRLTAALSKGGAV